MSRDVYIGSYRILKPLGQGGQGTVFLGYDERLFRRVAVKIYRSPTVRLARRNLLAEARAVARIQSPRVIQVHDIITSAEHLALVMEYVPGTNLERVLAAGRCPVAAAVEVAAELAAGLAVTRQQGIVHGDLKPSNVLVTTQGRIKLTDFGIARCAGERAGDVASEAALSPEQLLGEPLDLRSDLFGLGCIVYRMLSGRHPFAVAGRVLPELLLQGEHEPLSQVLGPGVELPEGLEPLVHSLLQRDPRDRPGNTHQVRQALREIDRQLPLSEGNALLRQARPLFEDEPPPRSVPAVPQSLLRDGRSRLGPSSTERTWSWHNPHARKRLLGMGLALAVAAVALGGALRDVWFAMPERIHLEAAELRLADGASLPSGVTLPWLMSQFGEEVLRQTGDVHLTEGEGGAGPAVVYGRGRSPADQEPRERLQLSLSCDASFCLLDLQRRRGSLEYSAQRLLAVNSGAERWRAGLRRAARALYQQPGLRSGAD